MINYTFDQKIIEISEDKDGEDIAFNFILKNEEVKNNFLELKKYFQGNGIICDALFYSYHNGKTKVIVQGKYYVDFVIYLFKYNLIEKLERN
jgi:hypothetical protein